MKKVAFVFFLLFCCTVLRAQYASISTDVSVLRSFTRGSRFWAFGQTVQGQYHFDKKTTAYAWVSYYTPGNFDNNLSALATDSTVSPQVLAYNVSGSLRYRHISVGLRHYLKGAFNSETTWNLYGITGFGLLLVRAVNNYNQPVDPARYAMPHQVQAGSKTIVRLTADVGLGVEMQLGSGIYGYADGRTWIQSTRFRSPYLYNNAVPRTMVLSTGIRILFD